MVPDNGNGIRMIANPRQYTRWQTRASSTDAFLHADCSRQGQDEEEACHPERTKARGRRQLHHQQHRAPVKAYTQCRRHLVTGTSVLQARRHPA